MRTGIRLVLNACLILLLAVLTLGAVSLLQSQTLDTKWPATVDPRLRLDWDLSKQRLSPRLSASGQTGRLRRVVLSLSGPQATVPPGATILARNGDVATALIDLSDLPEIASSPQVLRIAPESRVRPKDDPGVASIRAERVPVKLGVTGEGVIIGVLDSGIDWTHRDFRAPDGTSRILALLDLSDSPDSLKPGDIGEAGPYGGILVTREMIDQALAGEGNIRERDFMGHGTHVTGTAAASPSTNGDSLNTFGGVAPGADIVFVKIASTPHDSSFSDYNIMNGTAFIDSLAGALGRPCVINMSFGDELGSHDGTGSLEKFLAGYVNGGQRGRSIVVAAGNERASNLHARGDFTKLADSTATLNLSVGGGDGYEDFLRVEIWLSHGHPGVALQIVGPSGTVYGPYADGFYMQNQVLITNDGVLSIENAAGGPSTQNGDRQILIDMYDPAAVGLPASQSHYPLHFGNWKIILRAATGQFDAYAQGASNLSLRFTTFQTESGTIGDPATHPDLIAVGSYVARTDFPSLDPTVRMGGDILGVRESGRISSFSSEGPNRYGVLKPEITAPGQYVLATFSQWADPVSESLSIYQIPYLFHPYLLIAPDSIHAVSQGTSFAAPHVAGLCALLFQADPNLTNQDIRQILTETASGDSVGGTLPNNTWGYGRADAVDAVRMVLGVTTDSLAVWGSLEAENSLSLDSVMYTQSVDFSASPEVISDYSFRLTFPPKVLTPVLKLDSLGRLRGYPDAAIDTSGILAGILSVRGKASKDTGGREILFRIRFHALAGSDADSAVVQFEVLALDGDFMQRDLTGRLKTVQAGALRLQGAGFCKMQGDIDHNGKVDIFDLLSMLRMLGGATQPNACSDVNADGRTDIFDLLSLLKML